MSQYHADLQADGVFSGAPAGFADLQPSYVAYAPFQSATTERGRAGGCGQMVMTWVRTDLHYAGDCNGQGFMPLPPYQTGAAIALAASRGIRAGYGTLPAAPAPPAKQPPAAAPTQGVISPADARRIVRQ
jgi:hypothetical protein